MRYDLRYHPDVKDKDLPKINKNIQKRIKTAIEQRLLVTPEKYSEPLKGTSKGYRKLRVGDYRIVSKVEKDTIVILGICHGKDIYERMGWAPPVVFAKARNIRRHRLQRGSAFPARYPTLILHCVASCLCLGHRSPGLMATRRCSEK